MQDKSKILIVDDEPDIVSYLELVLQDLVMPVMDGFTVCRKLKEGEATRLIPVIIMTALDGIDDRVKAIELGADEVLAKPVNHRELVARLKTAHERQAAAM